MLQGIFFLNFGDRN